MSKIPSKRHKCDFEGMKNVMQYVIDYHDVKHHQTILKCINPKDDLSEFLRTRRLKLLNRKTLYKKFLISNFTRLRTS